MATQLDITDRLITELQAASQAQKIDLIEGRTFTTKTIHEILPRQPDPIGVHTLSAVVDYVNQQKDNGPVPFLVQVTSPTAVEVRGWLDTTTQRRDHYVNAQAITPDFRFDTFLPIEDFIIKLQTQFAESDDLTSIVTLVSNIDWENAITWADDGITQKLTAKVGIQRRESVSAPRLATLRPYRTFKEVARQPDSVFLLRLKREEGKPPAAALFQADGSMWQVQAIGFVKSYLEENIAEGKAIIIG